MKQSEMKTTEMYDYLLEHEIATTREIHLVTHINGYNKQSMIDILKVRTGYDFDQYEEFEAMEA